MICLGCGARVGDGCACVALGPYRAPDAAREGACPRCSMSLIVEDYADTPLDECSQCGGVFVEAWILDRLAEAREARLSLAISLPERPLHRETEVRYLRCPRCQTLMNRKIFGRSSGIAVDVCKTHGMWFDAGELAAVINFIEGGGLERARAKAEQERADEARKLKTQRAVAAVSDDGPSSMRSELAAEIVRSLLEWWR